MISCRCAEVSDGGVSGVKVEDEAAARLASRRPPPSSSGGVVSWRLFVQGNAC